MRIAVGGFQHETNTFAPQQADLGAFLAPDAWPGLVRGPDLIDAIRGVNLPAAGFIDTAIANGHSILPLTWCSATPSAHVTREAYEHIVALLLDDLQRDRHVDAVYLDLHGAMVAEHVHDADGELLRRVRALVGEHVPIVASLDFHANVSEQMVAHASALVAYRTYPHIDMGASGARAAEVLDVISSRQASPPVRRLAKLPFLIPLTSQCTWVEPLASVMQEVAQHERDPLLALNFTPGFPAADVPECGPALFGAARDLAALERVLEVLRLGILEREPDFALDIYSIEATLAQISAMSPCAGHPLILADTQDNPGGGGSSDTTSLIKALHAQHCSKVLAGLLCDPQAAARAHDAGIGAHVDLELGGRCGPPGETPITARFEVLALGDGRFTATGPFYSGARMDLGPMALLNFDGIHIAVSSRKQQAADQAMFRHLHADPIDYAILVLKSSVHFRADFGAYARRILVVEAPGANVADPAKLPFRNLPAGIRLSTTRNT